LSKVVTATEVKQNFGKYLDYVEKENDDIVITKNAKKIARLTPYVTDIERYFTVHENAMDYAYGGKKVSYEEFLAISEKSTLRMEYLNGEITLLTSPSFEHQVLLGRLFRLFSDWFAKKKCTVLLAPFDITFQKINDKDYLGKGHLDPPDVLQPDLMVICDYKEGLNEQGKYMGTPTLVIEILSESTRARDMLVKNNTYRLSGVKEYWVVDGKKKTIQVFSYDQHDIVDNEYFSFGSTAKSRYFTGLSCDVNELFDDLSGEKGEE